MPDEPGPRVVRAAGGVLWRRVDGRVEVALVHRPKYGDWSLPKGKLDPGEIEVVGAVREVAEETGFSVLPGRSLGVSRYRVLDHGRDVAKTVQWWALRCDTGEFVPTAEVDQLRWMAPASALARVSAGYDCAPLKAFSAHPPDPAVVLLLRHGSAGVRETWDGDDDERPLDETGSAQAQAAAQVLTVYGVQRVLAAPLLRCLQTVQPLADRLGAEVEPAKAAREDENGGGAVPLTQLLRDLAGSGRRAVVCTQGGAIPEAVRALSGVSDVRARKGSLWVLSLDGDVLVDAHYTARLLEPV